MRQFKERMTFTDYASQYVYASMTFKQQLQQNMNQVCVSMDVMGIIGNDHDMRIKEE